MTNGYEPPKVFELSDEFQATLNPSASSFQNNDVDDLLNFGTTTSHQNNTSTTSDFHSFLNSTTSLVGQNTHGAPPLMKNHSGKTMTTTASQGNVSLGAPGDAQELNDFFKQEQLNNNQEANNSNMTGFGSNTEEQTTVPIPEFLRGAKHPVVCMFHLLFKVACLFFYLFGSWLWTSAVFTYIFCILMLAFDFWTVKNVTGRLLVGLRWWNIIKEEENGEETNEWVFESMTDETTLNPIDKNVFWLGTYAWAGVWSVFLLINILSLNLSWIVFLAIAQVFAWSNLVAFWKCSRDQKSKLQAWATNNMLQAAGLDRLFGSLGGGGSNNGNQV